VNLKRAVILGAAVYIISFALNELVALAVSDSPEKPSITIGVSGIVITLIVLVLCTKIYLKTIKPSAREGFLFGITTAIAGIILDTIITLIADVTKPLGNLDNIFFWAANGFVIIVPIIVASLAAKKQKKQE